MVDRSADHIYAEAAAWLARLSAEDRNADTDGGLQAWLAADPAHVAAFEHATDVWEILPGAAALGLGAANDDDVAAPRRAVFALVASIALILSGIGGYYWSISPPVFETVVGSQQALILDDGSRVSLNTDSKIAVLFTATERRVRLERGEAFFEVTKNPARPFIVETDRGSVRALGTKFVVRRDADQVAVTLLEGKVEVTRQGRASKVRPVILKPGQRVTLIANAGAALDVPSAEAATAWRRGEVIFDDMPLISAASELNRYGDVHVVIDDPEISALRVSGVFATSDAEEFARAIASLHGLTIEREGDTLRLTR